ncbi:hypothetical protein ABZX90_16860 [Streptomyces sp. NPDC002935]|uniref:hypothetical protein n=1 Tax=Streptomyces sp. NPDC002935 TaxID=3154545 RepID=UPI0033BDDF0A
MTATSSTGDLTADAGYRARREAEVRHLTSGLRVELDDWTLAAGQNGPLEKHRSQIESAVRVVSSALLRLQDLPPAEHEQRAPELVLDLHHLWDFFRTKLLARHIPRYKAFLDAADELAWFIYDPVRGATANRTALKEPPLTFLNRQPVPFAAPRGSDFEELLPAGRQRTLSGRRASKHLPFPLIGIPWSASHHLPSLLAVAHETGHHIEDDFALTQALRTRLREHSGLAEEAITRWEPWLGEVFADVCATLACGDAYLWTLTDMITATGPSVGTGTKTYPPPHLRLLVCRAALTAGADAPASQLPALGGSQPGDAEAEAVVAALTGEGFPELGGATLSSLIGLRRTAGLKESIDRLLAGLQSRRGDVTGVLAAATLAFVRSPQGYDEQCVGDRALREVLSLVPDGPRAATLPDAMLAQRDSAAGQELLDLLVSGE